MTRTFRALRFLAAILLLAASVSLLAVWWIAHATLPILDGEVSLPELKQPVTVDRDRWAVPRIQAGSLEDLLIAQGYVVAQDRMWQMDILRRAAAGELSEIFGPAAIATDLQNRMLGLRLAAEKSFAATDADTWALLQAYARGVNHYMEERREHLPVEFQALRYTPRPWTPADSLLVGAYMYKVLTSSWEWEIKRAQVTEKLGPELARELYVADSPLDHPIVGVEPTEQAAPAERKAAPLAPKKTSRSTAETQAWANAERTLLQFEDESEFAFGSNNWVVSGEHTYSGKPLLANDTHLELEVPSIWYLAHLTAPGWNVKGFALPGVPLVIIGHDDRIA